VHTRLGKEVYDGKYHASGLINLAMLIRHP
jgi:hypothetical protein